ncbi:MAG: hypothetical protein ACLVEL_01765 [Ruthenibacterium sp.]|jgi:hypothetical protein
MKHIRKKIAAAVLCAALCLALAGCAPVGEAYPVSFGGVNITVGETTVEALLDAGYTIRALDENGVMGDVDATAQLNANSYYSGLYLAKDGVNCAGLEVTADEAVPLSGGTIARVYVAAADGHTLEGVTFDGVALSGLTPDVLTQHVEGCGQKESGVYELAGRDYTVRAGYENGQLVLLEMSRNYTVNG